MVTKKQVVDFISTVRNSFYGAEIVYTHGSCYQFYLILKQVFPTAKAYWNHDHVISKIGKFYYDINGVVYNVKNYLPFESYSIKMQRSQAKQKWKFKM